MNQYRNQGLEISVDYDPEFPSDDLDLRLGKPRLTRAEMPQQSIPLPTPEQIIEESKQDPYQN